MMNGINLIPAERRAAKQRRRRMQRWLGAIVVYLGIVLAACAGARVMWGGANTAAADELTRIDHHIEELNSNLAQSRKLLVETALAQQTAETISDQPDWSILLDILGATVGNEVVLREVHLTPDSANRKQLLLQLRGLATSQPGVSSFVLRLQEVGLFDGVKLLRTGREPVLNTTAVTFEISCTIGESGRARP